MSLETRINGRLIGIAEIRNVLDVGEGNYSYEVKYHRMGKDSEIIEFDIVHKREDGAEALALMVYNKLEKELKKDSK